MTTTLICEPIASISDDYFGRPKAGDWASSRDNTDDRGLTQTRRLALNNTDGSAIQLDCGLAEANWSTLSGDSA